MSAGAKTFTIPAAAMKWQRSGEHGISSNTIFETMTGFPVTGSWGAGYPHDPDDLRRCRLLLDAVPEFAANLSAMSAVGPEWAELVAIWPTLCSTMDAEMAKNGSRCPETYRLIKEAIEKGRAKRSKPENVIEIGCGR